MIQDPTLTCSSRHAAHTSIWALPGTVQTAVMGAGWRATHRSVCTVHVPVMTTPDGSTFMFSSLAAVREPRDESIAGILYEILPVVAP
jgi:hypothetical protein